MIDAEPLTVLLVHLPLRSTTSFGRSPVRTGGRPQKEGVFTSLRAYELEYTYKLHDKIKNEQMLPRPKISLRIDW